MEDGARKAYTVKICYEDILCEVFCYEDYYYENFDYASFVMKPFVEKTSVINTSLMKTSVLKTSFMKIPFAKTYVVEISRAFLEIAPPLVNGFLPTEIIPFFQKP